MAAFPLSILALAAGIALLIKVKKDGLGVLYKALSWLVIVLAVGFMLHLGRMAWHRHHDGMMMGGRGPWGQRMGGPMMMEKHWEIREDGKDSMGGMACCAMKGDSGAMSKEECMKKCQMSGNGMGGGSCSIGHGGGCMMHSGCCGMNMGGSCCGGGGNSCGSSGNMGKEMGDKGSGKACCKK